MAKVGTPKPDVGGKKGKKLSAAKLKAAKRQARGKPKK
jgi:hypothetical protein